MSDKTFTGLYLDKTLLDEIGVTLPKANCKTRNEFINTAIRYYIAAVNRKDYSDILTPAYESVIESKIQDTENRLARVIFKQGVEIAMMMHVIASSSNVDMNQLGELRKLCVNEVSTNGGKYSFDDAVKFQKL